MLKESVMPTYTERGVIRVEVVQQTIQARNEKDQVGLDVELLISATKELSS